MNIRAVLLVFGAGFALAIDGNNPMIHPQMRRALLEPRQTLGDLPNLSPSCTSGLRELYKSLPTPPPKLASAIVGDGRDPCSVDIPDSLSKSYSSFNSAVQSWYSKNSKEVSSALDHCSDLSSLVSLLPVCATSFLGGAAGSESHKESATRSESKHSSSENDPASKETATSDRHKTTHTHTGTKTDAESTGTDKPSSTKKTDTTAGAARETGMAVAALAAGIAAAIL